MLGHTELVVITTPLEVTQQMRDAASNRRGEWKVVTRDWDTTHPTYGLWGNQQFANIDVLRETIVCFAEAEIPRILHIFTHGKRNKTKIETIYANLEQVAETLWPSGSLEHVAMRFLAVPILVRVFAGHQITMVTYTRSWLSFFGYAVYAYQGECDHVAELLDKGVSLKSYPTYWRPYSYKQLRTQLVHCDQATPSTLSSSVASITAAVIGHVSEEEAEVGPLLTPTVLQPPSGILPTIPEGHDPPPPPPRPANPYIAGIIPLPSAIQRQRLEAEGVAPAMLEAIREAEVALANIHNYAPVPYTDVAHESDNEEDMPELSSTASDYDPNQGAWFETDVPALQEYITSNIRGLQQALAMHAEAMEAVDGYGQGWTDSENETDTTSEASASTDNPPPLVEDSDSDDDFERATDSEEEDLPFETDDAAVRYWIRQVDHNQEIRVPVPSVAENARMQAEVEIMLDNQAAIAAFTENLLHQERAAAVERLRQDQYVEPPPNPWRLLPVHLPRHGGNTPAEADIIANEKDRLVDNHGVKMIVGQDYYGEDQDTKQIVGVLTAPVPKLPNVYNKSSRNAHAAKVKRMDEKQRPYTGTPQDRKKIARLVGEACGGKKNHAIFSTKRIQKWAQEFFHIEDLKSKKWSLKRLEDSMNKVLAQAYPEFMHNGTLKCSVKLEQMEEGKPPRLIIMDGDDGQLMALVVVKCFEDLLFTWMEEKSTKHIAKRPGVKRLVKGLTKKGAKLVEGDGSAWDTTCGSSIRSQIEDPVLRHIMQVLTPFGVVPQQWHEEHLRCNEKKKLKLFFQNKTDKIKMLVNAIRRSGHRGTSCLNWWVNFVNWVCSIFKQPERFLDPKVRRGEDETGHSRWWNGGFEGDDSLCSMFPPMEKDGPMDKIFMLWWERQGFNMKIVYADGRATFCGYHIVCVAGEPTGFVCPELPRALVGAGVSCSSTIIEAAKDGNVLLVRDIAAAGALARAAEFAGLLPSVSRKFHEYAISVKHSREVCDREMSMRVMGVEGYNFTDLEAGIESQNLFVTPTEEHANLRALLCPATQRELDTFVCQSWTFESIGDFKTHRASLPESWRPPN